jgi:HAD superfamily hydrolase (TIGR01509 family)
MIDFNNIKGVVFDADGTLFDSMWKWRLVEAEYLECIGLLPEPDLLETLRTLNLAESAAYIQAEYGIPKTEDELSGELNAMLEEFYSQEVLLKAGVVPVLEEFVARGIKMCVATATEKYLIEAAQRHTGIYGYFGEIFTCGEEKTSKSRPDIFIRAAGFLGTEINETLVIEDALHAIKSAKSAGFPVVGVYDPSADMHQEEIKALCDIYILSLDELKSH